MVITERCLTIIITTWASPTTLVINRLRPSENRPKTTPPAGRTMKRRFLMLEAKTLERKIYKRIFFKYLKGCHIYNIHGPDKSWSSRTHQMEIVSTKHTENLSNNYNSKHCTVLRTWRASHPQGHPRLGTS